MFYTWSRRLCKLFFGGLYRMRSYGEERVPRTGPVILAANHQSYFDPVIVGAFVRRTLHYMARDTLFKNRWFGSLIRSYNAFPVKRGTADVGAIKESLRRLRAGNGLLMFPEGTRTPDGRVLTMHPGVISIARRSDATIVPVALDGVFEAWPRDRKYPRWARAAVIFGDPLTTADLEGLDDRSAADLLTQRIRALQNELRQRAGRAPFEYAALPAGAE